MVIKSLDPFNHSTNNNSLKILTTTTTNSSTIKLPSASSSPKNLIIQSTPSSNQNSKIIQDQSIHSASLSPQPPTSLIHTTIIDSSSHHHQQINPSSPSNHLHQRQRHQKLNHHHLSKKSDSSFSTKTSNRTRHHSPPIRIPIEPGHCLVFGRKPDLSLLSNQITPKSILLPITLPKSFTHASRTHCLCTLIAPPLGGLNIRIVVKGQNGLMVDGERFEEGSSAGVELERRDGEQIELGFYGGKKVECYVKIDDHSHQRVRTRALTQPTTTTTTHQNLSSNNLPQTEQLKSSTSTRGRKRKTFANTTPTDCKPTITSQSHQQLDSNPHHPLPPPSALNPSSISKLATTTDPSDLNTPDTTPGSNPSLAKKICLSPMLSASYDESRLNGLQPSNDCLRNIIQSQGLDLVGLIASAIVFSSRATVSTTEVVRAVLETQPSLVEAILSLLPTPSSSRSSPRPGSGHDDFFGLDSGIKLKKERECLSAPLPSLDHTQDDPPDTKPFATDLKPSTTTTTTHPLHYGSEGGGGVGSPALDFHSSDIKTDRVIHICRAVMLETLQNHCRPDGTGVFGCVTNEGLKDASGEPLEALWYYQPLHDPDTERRMNLQPYVRHVRHTQTTSKQYFFKKVRGSGRRKS